MQGEITPDQLFSFRPIPFYGDYRTPIRRPLPVRRGNAPRRRVMGVPGRNAVDRDAQGRAGAAGSIDPRRRLVRGDERGRLVGGDVRAARVAGGPARMGIARGRRPPGRPDRPGDRAASRDAVLDVPCGTGRIAKRLAGQGFDVVGVDITDRFLDEARSAGLARRARGHAAECRSRTRSTSRSACGARSATSTTRATSRRARAACRALKPGGRYLIDTLCAEASPARVPRARLVRGRGDVRPRTPHVRGVGTGRVETGWTFLRGRSDTSRRRRSACTRSRARPGCSVRPGSARSRRSTTSSRLVRSSGRGASGWSRRVKLRVRYATVHPSMATAVPDPVFPG